ncbi:AraC-like DNA-binding protein [Hydrogenophaga palleronii]|uniref:AraC-like DNA-binding protein n=1 Tax=Hydrogenophaga palleronii TaxID=65655 RepID=A0ABU1WJB8_9BURK|nr:AraC family transcriptional regulator [Hydrogenophaga palleronii]MDR7149382.1 AraC-like DNA-binding protein [Hydrogenophaga palleronii]
MSEQPDLLSVQPAEHPRNDEVLSDVLRWLRIDGGIFLRAELRAPWAYESPPSDHMAAVLKPGAQRLILFHIVAQGQFGLRLPNGTGARLAAGDVIILPYGDQHRVASTPDAELVDISTLIPSPPWTKMPVLRIGEGGELTQIVCGYLHSDDILFNPVLSALPRLMHLRSDDTPLADWVRASFRYALHATELLRPADDLLLQRLPELLFVECLRRCLAAGSHDKQGWFGALADPVVGRALQLLHGDYARPWTLDSLAREAASSRSRLDERFRRHLGVAPMAYLARWWLQVAGQLLRSTTRGVADIADSVGYGSEASLSRAFKRYAGVSPAAWRRGGAAR